jgi:hypothetical protein
MRPGSGSRNRRDRGEAASTICPRARA